MLTFVVFMLFITTGVIKTLFCNEIAAKMIKPVVLKMSVHFLRDIFSNGGVLLINFFHFPSRIGRIRGMTHRLSDRAGAPHLAAK